MNVYRVRYFSDRGDRCSATVIATSIEDACSQVCVFVGGEIQIYSVRLLATISFARRKLSLP